MRTDEENALHYKSVQTRAVTMRHNARFRFVLQKRGNISVEASPGEVLIFREGRFWYKERSVAAIRYKLPNRSYYRITDAGKLEGL